MVKHKSLHVRANALLKKCSVVLEKFYKEAMQYKEMEMGCVPGEQIKVEQVAPLGDPISISVAGYNLSLRLNEAHNIFVEDI